MTIRSTAWSRKTMIAEDLENRHGSEDGGVDIGKVRGAVTVASAKAAGREAMELRADSLQGRR